MNNVTFLDQGLRPPIKLLFLFTAMTFPLYAVDFLRLHLGNTAIAIPTLSSTLLMMVGVIFIFYTLSGKVEVRKLSEYRNLFLLTMFFFLWHVFSLERAQKLSLASYEVLKLTVGLSLFWAILTFCPKDKKFLERFWIVVLWSSTILMAYLIYLYAVVFKAPFLNKYLTFPPLDLEIARKGKNHPAWYLAVITPYAFFYFWQSRYKWLTWFPLFILSLALLYSQSRGSWLALLIGIGYILVNLFSLDRQVALKIAGIGITTLAFFILLISIVATHFINLSEIPIRMLSIIHPQAISDKVSYLGKHSYLIRWERIQVALEGFRNSPLIGIGINNSLMTADIHNDYVKILSELGIIGEFLFLGILFSILRKLNIPKHLKIDKSYWLSFATRASFISLIASFFFLHSYSSPFFFSICSLCLIARALE